MVNNPYEILKVAPTATQEDIKAAYRKLAKKFHPDLNPGNKEAESRFKDINAAYSLVDSVENRAKFDQGEVDEKQYRQAQQRGAPFYSQTQTGGGRYSNNGSNPFEGMDSETLGDLFSHFGRSAPNNRPQREETYQVEISFTDAVLGAEREITFPNGKTVQLKIPAGVDSGIRLRFAGKGENGGDAFVQVNILPSLNFKRDGKDILTDADVPFDVAILGGEIKVPVVDGVILLKIPPDARDGQKMRVTGKGVPFGGDRGALIVKLNVKLPAKVDDEFRLAVAAWSARQNAQVQAKKESL